MSDDLGETIVELIKLADPDGQNHQRLVKLLDKVDRRVMLGPKSMRYIEGLVQQKDNIECKNLERESGCKVPSVTECKHHELYRRCQHYQAITPKMCENPLAAIGGTDAR